MTFAQDDLPACITADARLGMSKSDSQVAHSGYFRWRQDA
jgi:hypothetical protein